MIVIFFLHNCAVYGCMTFLTSGLKAMGFFFFKYTAPTEIYTLSLHDTLPICGEAQAIAEPPGRGPDGPSWLGASARAADRKSTRLNSSHVAISYAVFCLK